MVTGFLDRGLLSWWDEIAWMVRGSCRAEIGGDGWFDAPLVFDEPRREKTIHALLAHYKSLNGDAAADAYVNYLAEATGSGRFQGAPDDLWMTWDMVRAMRAGGVDIGAHTVTHPILASLTKDRQTEEIGESIRRIAEETGARTGDLQLPGRHTGKIQRGHQSVFTRRRHRLRVQPLRRPPPLRQLGSVQPSAHTRGTADAHGVIPPVASLPQVLAKDWICNALSIGRLTRSQRRRRKYCCPTPHEPAVAAGSGLNDPCKWECVAKP